MRLTRAEIEQDLYAALGVRATATAAQLRQAYRREARRWHPDLHASKPALAAERMKVINVAASVLLDPARRTAYDQLRAQAGAERAQQRAARTPPSAPAAPPRPRPAAAHSAPDARSRGAPHEPASGEPAASSGAPAGFGAASPWSGAAHAAGAHSHAYSWAAPRQRQWPGLLMTCAFGLLCLVALIAGMGSGSHRRAPRDPASSSTLLRGYRIPTGAPRSAWTPTSLPSWTPPPLPAWSPPLFDYEALREETRRQEAQMRRLNRLLRSLQQRSRQPWAAAPRDQLSWSASLLDLSALSAASTRPLKWPALDTAAAARHTSEGGEKWWGTKAPAASKRPAPGRPKRSFWGDLAGGE